MGKGNQRRNKGETKGKQGETKGKQRGNKVARWKSRRETKRRTKLGRQWETKKLFLGMRGVVVPVMGAPTTQKLTSTNTS